MRKVIIGFAAVAAAVAAVRLGPTLAQRGMTKCHEMMVDMQRSGRQGGACHEEPLKVATV